MKLNRIKEIKLYTNKKGQQPFILWLESFKDKVGRYRIKERLDRISLGNMGDYKFLSDGVSEFRLDFGSGYRIYFAEEGSNIILLLCAGNKGTQKKDIKKAIAYWNDYLSR